MSRVMDVKKSHFFYVIIVSILVCLLASSAIARTNLSTDRSALLTLKAHITLDPIRILKNWTISSSVCNWIGVTCGKRHLRVTQLDISNMDLSGSIPPALGNLSFIVSIDISNNNFNGALFRDLVHLRRLRFFFLKKNNFIGEVPPWLSSLPQIRYLSIRNNRFTSLNSFLLSSTNKSKLTTLDVSFNPFQGEIPQSIGNLHNLKWLVMQKNKFSGSIPLSIMNMSRLETLALGGNSLQGMIPKTIGSLHKLNRLTMQGNRLNGSIPLSIFNLSRLEFISFYSNDLSGTLPNGMCLRLPALKEFSISINYIGGQIPSNLSSCHRLQSLSLSNNSFTGIIPQEIGSIEILKELYLGGNKLTGSIPPNIDKLDNLQELALEMNLLTGSIPSTIFNNMTLLQELYLHSNHFSGSLTQNFGNLTRLKRLELGGNSFTGVIPRVFGKLTKLRIVDLSLNRLSGSVPSSIFNISTLRELSLAKNDFLGNILPTDMGTFLPNLEGLYLGNSNLHGVLPSSISNSSQLKILDLPFNNLAGSIPNSLGNLNSLRNLVLNNNNFSSESASFELSFITSLTRSRFLKVLSISYNPLNGVLPLSIGNLSSSLQEFYAIECKIKGYIPNEIGNLSGLGRFTLRGNDLTGEIPSELGKISNIQELDLAKNGLSRFIPNSLCILKSLGALTLGKNQLTGAIPECLGNATSLRNINLDSNNLTSGVPNSIWSLQDLLELDISTNSFTGSLSSQIGNLKVAVSIDLSMNRFSDVIPNTFGNLQSVINLALASNRFEGSIPESMGSMLSLVSLDLSDNILSGTIPKSLESLTELQYLNVSFNKLYGEIPTDGPFKNFTSQSFTFNAALCGSPRFNVSPCKESLHGSKKKKTFRVVFIVTAIGALVFIGIIASLIIQYHKKNNSLTEPDILGRAKPQRMSYYKLLKATNGCSEDNLLGRGSFGSVYKAVLEDGTILAIKVFNMLLEVASKTFDTECEALRNLRHRNLIKVIGSCSNQDFKAILLEYMPNGSLEKWLYFNNHVFDIMQRLSTMIDVANALEYLHYGYSTPVVHCDLKPSNILMDEIMIAHLSDFGITRFLGEDDITYTRTLATLGYMAPEYGSQGRVSTACDVYSYGIILLEIFTRKRPSDAFFSGDVTLKNWVKDLLPYAPTQVIDSNMIGPGEANFSEKLSCASSVMELALKCCADSPEERMNMKDVLVELKKIKAKFMLHCSGTSNLRQE